LQAVQDRITRAVAGALALRIDEELLQKAKARPDADPAVYDCWLRGKECLHQGTPHGTADARDFFLRALEIEPGYGRAHAGLAMVYFTDWNCHDWKRWEECEQKAFDHARKAVALDDGDHVAHCVLSRVHLYRRAFEQVEKHVDRALTLNANDADCLARSAATKAQLGEAMAGIELGRLAFALNPRYPDWYVGFIGLPYLMAARHAEAVAVMERAPDAYIDTRALLAASYAYLGRAAEARIHAEAFLAGYGEKIAQGRRFDGTEAMRWLLQVTPFRLESDTAYLREGVTKAGIGEGAGR
jgi:tetratricopeptide (TPR) repeat protein